MTATIDFFENVVKSLNLDSGNAQAVEQFDDRRFRFGVYLLNQDNRAVKLRRGSIEELVIVDDILDWFHHGHIIFSNPDDILERPQSQLLSEGPTGPSTGVIPYRFRGDGRDMLYMFMEPHINNDDPRTIPQKMDSAVHTMRFLFSVYAVEDIESPQGKKYKQQKLYFHDYRLQMLREKTLFYSTAKNMDRLGMVDETQRSVTHKNNNDRSKNTGEILQDLLSSALLTTDTSGLFSKHWEFGDKKMFYTSPSEFKALDDINYILDRHVSSVTSANQPCILKLQRQTERWELLPVSEYFNPSLNNDGPGPYQSEFFLLSFDSEAQSAGQTSIPPPKKTFGRDRSHPMLNYHYPDISIIDDYTFSEINGVDCQEILNSVIVHRYDEKTKQFSVDVKTGNIKNVRSEFQGLFIDKTFGGEQGHGHTGWLSDSTRDNNLNIQIASSWTPDKTSSLTVGRNKTLLGAFLLGNTIQFKSRGTTSRRSGVWIAIDRDNSYIDNEYDMKVLGQYFITRVTHTITTEGYTNSMMGVKPFVFRDPGYSTNDIFFKNPEEIKY
jgi:hypothetical protein